MSNDYRHGENVFTWQPTDFQRGAIEAAFWTADPLPQSGEFAMDWHAWNDRLDVADRRRFIEACEAVEKASPYAYATICGRVGRDMRALGADWYLTSQGHGVGLWDASRWGRYADALDKACKLRPLPELYADIACEVFHASGEGCGECDACAQGPSYYVG